MRLIDADALIRECEEELKDESLWHDEDTTKDYAEGNDDGKRIIMTIIDSAPTIEPKRGEWIPCNERLPDKSGEYLAYSIIGLVPDHIGDPNIRQDTTVAYYSRTFNEWIGNGVEKVLAWMPLPEPWKGADEDEKVWKIGEVIVGGEREGE